LLKDLYLEEKLTLDQYQLGQELLSPSRELDELDRRRLTEFLAVADGKLAPDKLSRALDAIETPAQRQARMAPVLELGNGVKLKLVNIGAGEFQMGSELSAAEVARKFSSKAEEFEDEHPQHKVKIEKPFYMGKFEVTRSQFRQFVTETDYRTDAEKDGKGGWGWTGSTSKQSTDYSWRDAGFKQDDDHPVANISWNDAVAFCAWLSKKCGGKVRLPTEAEWEYAARGGKQTVFPWGNDPDDGAGWGNAGDQTANAQFNVGAEYSTFSWRDGYVFTAPFGKFKSNAFDLHDMFGNVSEWTSSKNSSYPYRSTDGREEPAGTATRVLRGGSWRSLSAFCRLADRRWVSPQARFFDYGFRVVLEYSN